MLSKKSLPYDLHVHIGKGESPIDGTIFRRFAIEDLTELPMAGIVVKAHHFIPQIPSQKTDLIIIPSLTLNNNNGGLSKEIIFRQSKIWTGKPWLVNFPTVDSYHHISKTQKDIAYQRLGLKSSSKAPIAILKDRKLLPVVEEILDTIALLNQKGERVILTTGHLSWSEAKSLAEKALERKIITVITHPNQRHILMPIEVQKKLAAKGAWIEHCAIFLDSTQTVPGVYTAERILSQIRKIGLSHCFLSSDCGQKNNQKFPHEALNHAINQLKTAGASDDEIKTLTILNPRIILGFN